MTLIGTNPDPEALREFRGKTTSKKSDNLQTHHQHININIATSKPVGTSAATICRKKATITRYRSNEAAMAMLEYCGVFLKCNLTPSWQNMPPKSDDYSVSQTREPWFAGIDSMCVRSVTEGEARHTRSMILVPSNVARHSYYHR